MSLDGLPYEQHRETSPESQPSCSWNRGAGSLGAFQGGHWRDCSVDPTLKNNYNQYEKSAICASSHVRLLDSLFAISAFQVNWRKWDLCPKSCIDLLGMKLHSKLEFQKVHLQGHLKFSFVLNLQTDIDQNWKVAMWTEVSKNILSQDTRCASWLPTEP